MDCLKVDMVAIFCISNEECRLGSSMKGREDRLSRTASGLNLAAVRGYELLIRECW